jgi:hypothetical protein
MSKEPVLRLARQALIALAVHKWKITKFFMLCCKLFHINSTRQSTGRIDVKKTKKKPSIVISIQLQIRYIWLIKLGFEIFP